MRSIALEDVHFRWSGRVLPVVLKNGEQDNIVVNVFLVVADHTDWVVHQAQWKLLDFLLQSKETKKGAG